MKVDFEVVKLILCIVVYALALWFLLSLASSLIKSDLDNCGKQYPIDYVFYTNLFCEIEYE